MENIENHFNTFTISKTDILGPKELFSTYLNNKSGQELDILEDCITSNFRCLNKEGYDFNPNNLSLIEFLKVNPKLHSNHEVAQIQTNIGLIRNKIQELEDLLVRKFEMFAQHKNQVVDPSMVLSSNLRRTTKINDLIKLNI